MNKSSLEDNGAPFDVTVLEASRPARVVLFAVGGGGNPERHLPLLNSLAERGCTVVAPHFERLVSPVPTLEHLRLRARRLRLALHSLAPTNVAVAGVGHSIGATMLIALAGGHAWTRAGEPLEVVPEPRVDRLALFAPATGFFQAPGALNDVKTPICVWAAALDTITPPAQALFLERALGERVAVEVRLAEDASHFSFMNTVPPQVQDSIQDRAAFLARISTEVCDFVTAW